LKRSLWYGLQDAVTELSGQKSNNVLRKDEFWAVKDVSFELRRGECLGILGNNGAGKTTLLRILHGLIKPDKGHVQIKGKVDALIALGAGFNPVLTGRENIYISGSVAGLSKKETDSKLEEILEFSELSGFIDTPLRSYSSGMQVRLGFAAAALLIEPDVLILDEVLAVGDRNFRSKCYNVLGKLFKKTAVILVSHQTNNISRLCDLGLHLKSGELNYFGDISEALNKYHSSSYTNTLRKSSSSGSMKVFAQSICLLEDEQPIIRFDIQSSEAIDSIECIVNVKEDDNIVCQLRSVVKAQKGEEVVDKRFPHLPLSPGMYYCDLEMRDLKNHEVYHVWTNCLQIIQEGDRILKSAVVINSIF
jgi:lipopolysaccharide transport system ATP-binding protein